MEDDKIMELTAKLTRDFFGEMVKGIEQLIERKPEATAKDVLRQLKMTSNVISAMFGAIDEEVKINE